MKVQTGGSKRHIYCVGTAPNPYSKPKVNFDPTRLNVRASGDSSSSSVTTSPNNSPASTSPLGSPKQSPKRLSKTASKPSLSPSAPNFVPNVEGSLSPSAPKFVPNASLYVPSQASDSSSDTDGEYETRTSPSLPQLAHRASSHGAAFAPPPGLLVSHWQTVQQAPVLATGWQPFNPPLNLHALEAH